MNRAEADTAAPDPAGPAPGEPRVEAAPAHCADGAAAPAAPAEQDVERLRWQCRRGMLELDLLLNRFLALGYDDLDAAGRAAFARLLGYPDPILQDWLIGHAVPSEAALRDLLPRIRAATQPRSPGHRGVPR